MLLFGTLCLFYFQSFIQKDFFFYVDNDVCLEQTFWNLKIFEYFENEPEQLGIFKWNMHEQINVDNQFQFKLLAGLPPRWRSVVNGKNEKTEWKPWKMNMLAKSKTRKGGLGKKEHPDGLTTFEGNSGKNRGIWKKIIPRWIENPKGRSRQKWDDENKNEKK